MKKFSFIVSVLIVGLFVYTGSAMAYPYLNTIIPGEEHILPVSGDGGNWVSLTDLTDPATSIATLLVENSSYESGFGIYDPTNNQMLQVFNANAEPTFPDLTMTTIQFDIIGGTATIMQSYDSSLVGTSANINWNKFGFYLDSNSTGTIYYTDESLNPDTAIEHGLIYDLTGDSVAVAFEDLPYSSWVGSEPDYNDFVVRVSDVSPVPEPASMMLLGSLATGLFGFAGIRRRFRK